MQEQGNTHQKTTNNVGSAEQAKQGDAFASQMSNLPVCTDQIDVGGCKHTGSCKSFRVHIA